VIATHGLGALIQYADLALVPELPRIAVRFWPISASQVTTTSWHTLLDRILSPSFQCSDAAARAVRTSISASNSRAVNGVACSSLLEQAPAMAQILRELVAGVRTEQITARATMILRQIDQRSPRGPGEETK
jgi:hypothetical protein